jgi:hypothetical protein
MPDRGKNRLDLNWLDYPLSRALGRLAVRSFPVLAAWHQKQRLLLQREVLLQTRTLTL